jgi:hypothetical protein
MISYLLAVLVPLAVLAPLKVAAATVPPWRRRLFFEYGALLYIGLIRRWPVPDRVGVECGGWADALECLEPRLGE